MEKLMCEDEVSNVELENECLKEQVENLKQTVCTLNHTLCMVLERYIA